MPENNINAEKLNQISIVMVETTHPGNIGAAARAMHNMCFKQLILVDPQCPVGDIAYARSSGAHVILDQRKTVKSLPEAIEDCHLVIGLTARQRSLRWPELETDQIITKIQELGTDTRTALIFGREHSGLNNEEIALCNYMVSIRSNPEFSSLNVASAIQIICYEIYRSIQSTKPVIDAEPDEPPATAQDIEGYFSHLHQVLLQTEFIDTNNPGLLMQRLRRLYQRINLSKVEVNILRGILGSVEKYKK